MAARKILALAVFLAPLVEASPVLRRENGEFGPAPTWWFPVPTGHPLPGGPLRPDPIFPGGKISPDPVSPGAPIIADPSGPGGEIDPDEPWYDSTLHPSRTVADDPPPSFGLGEGETTIGASPVVPGAPIVPDPVAPGAPILADPVADGGEINPDPVAPGAPIVADPLSPGGEIVPVPEEPEDPEDSWYGDDSVSHASRDVADDPPPSFNFGEPLPPSISTGPIVPGGPLNGDNNGGWSSFGGYSHFPPLPFRLIVLSQY